VIRHFSQKFFTLRSMRIRGRKTIQIEIMTGIIDAAKAKAKDPTTKKAIAKSRTTIIATIAIERRMPFIF
jgi:hypothetical protein